MHTTGHFRGAGGLHLFYQTWKSGKSDKPVLVFIHGMGEHSDRYRFPVEYFSSRGYAVYVMDLRGHGNSHGRRVYADSIQQLLTDIDSFVQLVEEQEKGKQIFLIGHSFGGQLVINYAAQYPNGLKGIILSSPNIRLKLRVPPLKMLLLPVLSRFLPILALGNEIDPALISHDLEVVEAYKKDRRILRRITMRLAQRVLENQEGIFEFAQRLRLPCLLMHAGDDRICSPEGTRDFFDEIPAKDKSLKIYDGFYHELFNEVRRQDVFKDMEEWLEKGI